jgi:hypothetical protein
MKRAWAVLAVMSLVAMQGWASGLFSKPATVVFLLDTTLTVQHFDAFRRAWIRTVAELRDGDHVVLAVVKGDARGGPGGAFPYLIERTMPAYSIWKPYEEYRKEKAAVEKELLAAFETALTVGRFDKTLLLSSVRSLAEHLASGAGGPRVIIIAPSFLSRLIADERNLLRDKLKGVEVHVVAAGAATDKKALEVRRFWEALFRATGARLTPSWYAGELIGLRL